MTEKQLNQKESLDLITEMIRQAKSNYSKGGSFYFLLWGWIVMLANLGHFLIDAYTDYPHPYVVWALAIPAIPISVVYGIRQRKRTSVTSHMDRMYSQVWLAAGVGIIISIVFMAELSFNHNAVVLLFAAVGTYISGQMLRFRPLLLGGLALALASIIAFMVPVTEQYLVGGFGILFGYLVPGYLLKNKEK